MTSLTTLGGLPFFGTLGDDAFFQLTQQGNATVRWEIFASGTNQTVYAVGSPEFRIADIDGIGGATNTRESVTPSVNGLTSYTVSTPTNLVVSVSSAGIRASGTQDQNGESTSLVGFIWSEVSSWEINYTLHINDPSIQARFLHDGDGDFKFVVPLTTPLLGLDLDANDSTAIGTARETTFAENGAPVTIVDSDVAIVQSSVLGENSWICKRHADQSANGRQAACRGLYQYEWQLHSWRRNIHVLGNFEWRPDRGCARRDGDRGAVPRGAPADHIREHVGHAVHRRPERACLGAQRGVPNRQQRRHLDHHRRLSQRPTGRADKSITTLEDTPVTLTVADFGFSDPNDTPANTLVDVKISSLPANGTLSFNGMPITSTQVATGFAVTAAEIAAGKLTFTPDPNENGANYATFTFQVRDSGGTANGGVDLDQSPNTITFDVTATNDPPTVTGLGNGPIGSGTDAEVQESDLATGSTPSDVGETATGTFTIQAGDGLTSLQVGATTITAAQLAAATAAAPVTVTGTNGTLSITSYDPVTGIVSYGYTLTTPADHTGGAVTDPFAITLTDSDGDTASSTLAILIADDAPTAVSDTGTVTEDATTTATGNVVTANDTVGADVTTTPVSGIVAGLGSPAGTGANVGSSVTGTYGTLTLNADGTYTYNLNNSSDAIQGLTQGETVNDIFTYQITDADGDTSTATLTVAVVGANDTPVVIDPNNPGTPENPNPAPDPQNIIPDIVTIDSATPPTVDVSDYIVDPDGNTLTFTSTGLPDGLTLDPATGIISGDLPSDASQGGPNGDGIYPVTITATDPTGATTTTTITYTVTNPAPVAADDTATVIEDTPLNGFVDTNDSDPDGDDLLVTQFTIDGVSGATQAGDTAVIPGIGEIVINDDGSFTFTPELNYTGPVPVITYTISDGEGGTDTADLILTMTPVNDPPVAVDDTISVAEDTPASGNVIGNDTDPDGDPLTVVDYTVDGLPGPIPAGTPVLIPDVGTLFVDPNGAFTFTPIENYTGPIPEVIYTVTDNKGETDQGVLTLTIAPANDPPVAVDDTATVTRIRQQPATC
ncbi:MAG: tandem-95 repeat protein [Verrucomicrobiae bacterium]|nr:tandem-95 repeat protein [Verrucomicrobiae bacterium]